MRRGGTEIGHKERGRAEAYKAPAKTGRGFRAGASFGPAARTCAHSRMPSAVPSAFMGSNLAGICGERDFGHLPPSTDL